MFLYLVFTFIAEIVVKQCLEKFNLKKANEVWMIPFYLKMKKGLLLNFSVTLV